jgi:lipopolysaccharide export system protein LptC
VFRAAARHSRFVRFLRMAIPAGILAVAGVIIVATFFNPFRLIANFPIDPGKVSLSGTRIVMEAPRLNGFTSDGRPYELTARAAVQDITKPDLLELSGPVAHVDMKDGAHVDIQSINGLYDTKSELLKLSDHVVMVSSSGYEAYLSEATVTVRSGQIVSESPVSVKLPNGWLNSKRLEVVDNGALLRFGGGVDLTLEPESQAPPATTPAPAAPVATAMAPAPAAPPAPAKTPAAAAPAKNAAAAAAPKNPAAPAPTAPASAVSPSQRPVAP